MIKIQHILVPTDFSEVSERAVSMAVELATAFAARITLLHAWSIPNTGYAEALSWPIDEMEPAARAALENTLQSFQRLANIVRLIARRSFYAIRIRDWGEAGHRHIVLSRLLVRLRMKESDRPEKPGHLLWR